MRTHFLSCLFAGFVVLLASACGGRPSAEGVLKPRFQPRGLSLDLLCPLQRAYVLDTDLPEQVASTERDCGCGLGAQRQPARCHYPGGKDRRRSILLTSGSSLQVSVEARKSPRWLRFSARSLRAGSGAATRLRVALSGGGRQVSWERAVGPKEGWVDVSLDISALAGVKLSLEVVTDGAKSDHGLLALGMPRLIAASEDAENDAVPKANVLVYLIDTLRPDHMSIYGYERPTTPVIEAFFKEGLIFTHAYSTAAWTRPATASLLTSLYPSYHGANAQRSLADEVTTLAEHFRSAGFSTWAFVTNGNIFDKSLRFEQGFDRFVAVFGKERPNHALTGEVNEVLLPYLSEFGDEPFFLYVHTVDPHSPYDPPAGYLGRFTDTDYTGPVTPDTTQRKYLKKLELNKSDRDFIVGLYDEEIRYQDAMFGELLAALKERGQSDQLVTVVTSDHGEEFFEHGDWEHGRRLFEEQIRIPLLVKVPSPAHDLRGRRLEYPVQIVDVMPTLLGWFGIQRLAGCCQGKSLEETMDLDPGELRGRPIYCEEIRGDWNRDLFSLRKFDSKIIFLQFHEPKQSMSRFELFDLASDPEEQVDRAKEQQTELGRMRDQLHTMIKELAKNNHIAGETDEPALDEKTLRQLRALGYVDDQ